MSVAGFEGLRLLSTAAIVITAKKHLPELVEAAHRGSTPRDHRGEIVGERYRLIELLDRGGQATVYRGLDLRMGDEVAVKAVAPPKRAE